MNKWVLSLLALAFSTLLHAEAKPDLLRPIQLIIQPIQNPVQAFKGDGKYHVVYELWVTNSTKQSVEIMGVHVKGKRENSAFEFSVEGDEVHKIFALLQSNRNAPQDPILKANESGLLYLFLDFTSLDDIPESLDNSLDVQVVGKENTLQNISSNPLAIELLHPITVHPPVQGDNWYAEGGPSNFSYHRRAFFALNGNMEFSQRYAVDFRKYGPKGLFDGDPLDNKSYYSYGQNVLAAAAGTVVKVVEGVQENIPGKFPSHPTLENVGGNCVLIELDSHHYTFYGHMIPGSIRVKEGDKVQAGQLLGLLGNSGNSSGPHLHFHVTSRVHPIDHQKTPYFLNAQGIPWLIDSFTRKKYTPIGRAELTKTMPQSFQIIEKFAVREESLMQNDLVDFSQSASNKEQKSLNERNESHPKGKTQNS